MEGSMRDKFPLKKDLMRKLEELIKPVKIYNGLFDFLRRNSNINTFEWKETGSKYAQIIKQIV
jgi:hypothetical protein